MTELEKVIDDLGRVMACGQTMLDCGTESPMVFKMIRDAADNAIVFLKAQESVEPKKVNRYIDFDGEGHPYNPETYDCGACGKELPSKANYCPECGKKVKWDG